jgi:metal-responsive CopG/Arc/MetJ family transcriptional regulator
MEPRVLRVLDREARRRRTARAKLIRAAVEHYLVALRRRELEERDRRGYDKAPQRLEEIEPWLAVQAWPED